MLSIRAFVIAALIFGISGAGLASADEFLSATELKKLYSDVRVDSATRRGSPSVFNFRPDGTYSLKIVTPRRVIESEGKWWVEEPNRFCRTSPRSDQVCIRQKRTATGYDQYMADEDRKLQNVWNVATGDSPRETEVGSKSGSIREVLTRQKQMVLTLTNAASGGVYTQKFRFRKRQGGKVAAVGHKYLAYKRITIHPDESFSIEYGYKQSCGVRDFSFRLKRTSDGSLRGSGTSDARDCSGLSHYNTVVLAPE